jgi:hypothetical protein
MHTTDLNSSAGSFVQSRAGTPAATGRQHVDPNFSCTNILKIICCSNHPHLPKVLHRGSSSLTVWRYLQQHTKSSREYTVTSQKGWTAHVRLASSSRHLDTCALGTCVTNQPTNGVRREGGPGPCAKKDRLHKCVVGISCRVTAVERLSFCSYLSLCSLRNLTNQPFLCSY